MRNETLLVAAALFLPGCASSTYQPVDTKAVAADFVDACMGSWVYSPTSKDGWQGSVRLTLSRDFRFAGQFGQQPLSGTWEAFGTLDAGVRMTDAKTRHQIELVECPGDKPTLITTMDAGDLSLRRPTS
jgi:hypothetical protein